MKDLDYLRISPLIVVILDEEGKIEDINDRACELLGVKRSEVLGLNWFENFLPLDIRKDILKVFKKIIGGELDEVREVENEILTSTGERRLIRWRNAYIKDEHGKIKKTLSLGIDITEELRMRKELEKSISFYEFLIDLTWKILRSGWNEEILGEILDNAVNALPNAHSGSVVVKSEGGYRYAAVVGYDLEKLKSVRFDPEKVKEFASEPQVVSWKSRMMVRDANPRVREILIEHGRVLEIKSTLIFPITFNGEIVAYITLDNFESEDAFTENDLKMARVFQAHMKMLLWKEEMERIMKYMADHDPLTGALNRRAFIERMEKMVHLSKRQGGKFSIVYLDLNGFKAVNDLYGHDVGDAVLVELCERLREVLRCSDELGRMGGDEFVVLLNGADSRGAESFIGRLKRNLEKPISLHNGVEIKLSVALGIATYPDDAENINDLIRIADMRMYRDKRGEGS